MRKEFTKENGEIREVSTEENRREFLRFMKGTEFFPLIERKQIKAGELFSYRNTINYFLKTNLIILRISKKGKREFCGIPYHVFRVYFYSLERKEFGWLDVSSLDRFSSFKFFCPLLKR